jgi:predicted short-subunit dehydrogenase-like oxidoreductase (DUF2520 family)
VRRRSDRRIAFVGAGAVATAIGRALARKGFEVAFASRSLGSARRAAALAGGRAFPDPKSALEGAGVIFLTVPDSAIAQVCERLARAQSLPRGSVVLHTSGFHPSSVLAPARACGAAVASAHPLRSFADPGRTDLRGVLFALEGDRGALPRVRALVRRVGGRPVEIRSDRKALYHAAAAVTSNYTVAIVDLAREILGRAVPAGGLEPVFRGLLVLLAGTVENLERVGSPRALTGPIARGDAGVVRGHLAALARHAPSALPLYRALGLRAVEVARRKGTLRSPAAAEIRALLRP